VLLWLFLDHSIFRAPFCLSVWYICYWEVFYCVPSREGISQDWWPWVSVPLLLASPNCLNLDLFILVVTLHRSLSLDSDFSMIDSIIILPSIFSFFVSRSFFVKPPVIWSSCRSTFQFRKFTFVSTRHFLRMLHDSMQAIPLRVNSTHVFELHLFRRYICFSGDGIFVIKS